MRSTGFPPGRGIPGRAVACRPCPLPPPSKRATTCLSETGRRPGRNGVAPIRADAPLLMIGFMFVAKFHDISGTWATPANSTELSRLEQQYNRIQIEYPSFWQAFAVSDRASPRNRFALAMHPGRLSVRTGKWIGNSARFTFDRRRQFIVPAAVPNNTANEVT